MDNKTDMNRISPLKEFKEKYINSLFCGHPFPLILDTHKKLNLLLELEDHAIILHEQIESLVAAPQPAAGGNK